MDNANKDLNTRAKGAYYEDIALQYLVDRGFLLIERNFYTRYGEIDLIMQKDSILHFVEVKSSSTFHPFVNITQRKIACLMKSIDVYLLERKIKTNFCLDALSIYRGEISFVENITFHL